MNATATITAPTTPERTPDQRMEALKLANDIRSRRAQLKRDLAAKKKRPQLLIMDPPEWALTMRVKDALQSVPKLGRVKVDRMLRDCGCSPSKTIGGLSTRQRNALINALTMRGS